MRQCTNDSCRFRFPVIRETDSGNICPLCGEQTDPATVPFGDDMVEYQEHVRRPVIVEALLDNIRSGYNVGSIFRTADGAGVSHIHLGGISPTPSHPKVKKTALDADLSVPWTHHRNGLEAALDLKARGYRLLGLESCAKSNSLFDLSLEDVSRNLIAIIVGNEISGIDPAILEVCDDIFDIPMLGTKRSLNVIVAFGVAAYYIKFGRETALS